MLPADLSHFRNEIVRRSEDLLRRKRLDEARQSLLPLIAMAPEDAEAHLRIGAALIRQKKTMEGAAALGRAVALAPFRTGARLHYAHALNSIGRHDEALRQFTVLLALQPTRQQGHWGRGKALLALNRTEDAAAACSRASEMDPFSHDALFWLGCAEARRLRPNAAISSFQRALLLRPNSGATISQLGGQYLDVGRTEDGAAAFARLRAAAPQNAEGHFYWGIAMARLNRLADAVQGLDHASALNPKWPLPRLELWRNLVKVRRFAQALSLLRSAEGVGYSTVFSSRRTFYTLDQVVRRAWELGGPSHALEQAGALIDGIATRAALKSAIDNAGQDQLEAAIATAPASPLAHTAAAILASDWRAAFSNSAKWLSGGSKSLPAQYAEVVRDGPHQGHPLWHLLSPFYHAWCNARAEDSGCAVQQRWASQTNVFDAGRSVDDLLTSIPSIVEAHRPLIEALAPHVTGARVLDIGCGFGEWLYILGRQLGVPIRDLFGCDIHEARVRSARGLLHHLSRSQNSDDETTAQQLARNVFIADLLTLTTDEVAQRCSQVDLVLLSRITSVFNDAQLDRVLGQIAALNPVTIVEVCPTERWSYSFGRHDLTPHFARHGYRASVHGWLPEPATPEALGYLILPRKYWVSTRYYVFERASG